MKLKEHILAVAKTQLGVCEKPKGSNRGAQISEYNKSTGMDSTLWGAWCASYVCWVVMKAVEAATLEGAKFTFNRPKTLGAFKLQDWSLRQDNSTATRVAPGVDIEAGDIIILKVSHTGFATSKPNAKGYFTTNEGNTNDAGEREGYEVCERTRHISSVKSRIRFTV